MQTLNEEQIKKKLGIDSWRNISKDKVIKFAAMMPEMDKEVAIKIIEQFPEFAKFANEVVDTLEEEYKTTIKANADSQEEVFKAFREIREILKDELKRDGLSPEERMDILHMIMETGDKVSEKDSENKEFLPGLFKIAVNGAEVALVAALVFIGGKVLLERGQDS